MERLDPSYFHLHHFNVPQPVGWHCCGLPVLSLGAVIYELRRRQSRRGAELLKGTTTMSEDRGGIVSSQGGICCENTL